MGLALYRTVWIPSLLALGGMVAYFLQQPYQKPTIAAFKEYSTDDRLLTIQRPENWKPRQQSANSTLTAVSFKPSENVRFSIEADLAGSLFADLARSGDAQMDQLAGMINQANGTPTPATPQKSPLQKLHAMAGIVMLAEKDKYPEFSDGKPKTTSLAGQEAIISDFTFQKPGMFGAPQEMVGRRATLLTTERSVVVICYCPRPDSKTLLPIFNKMLKSLRVNPQ